MRILLTTDPEISVPPEFYGGAERLASDLIDEYVKLGHQVVLIANKNSRQPNVSKCYSWPASESTGIRNVLRNGFFLKKIYHKENPHIIHSFSRLLYHYPLFFSNAKFVKRYGRFISRHSTWLAKLVFGKRLVLVSAANHMLDHLRKKSEWEVIYNFINTEYYTSMNNKREGFVFIGRIEEIKGVHEAILTAIALDEKLIIAGNIEPEHQVYFDSFVKPFLNDKIQYAGMVNNVDKREILQKARATLFPIKWEEPFGIVMAESMACGTPVIGFHRGSVPEVILDGVSGYIVRNTEQMIEKASQLEALSNDTVRDYAVQKFSRKDAARQYIALFNQMIK